MGQGGGNIGVARTRAGVMSQAEALRSICQSRSRRERREHRLERNARAPTAYRETPCVESEKVLRASDRAERGLARAVAANEAPFWRECGAAERRAGRHRAHRSG